MPIWPYEMPMWHTVHRQCTHSSPKTSTSATALDPWPLCLVVVHTTHQIHTTQNESRTGLRMVAGFFMLVCTTASQSSRGLWIWDSESSPLRGKQQEDAFFSWATEQQVPIGTMLLEDEALGKTNDTSQPFESVLGAAEANHVRVAAFLVLVRAKILFFYFPRWL